MPLLRSPRLRSVPLGFLLGLVVAAGLGGCKQANGDRCQVDTDCQSGICVLQMGSKGLPEGTCEASNLVPPQPDTLPPLDMAGAAKEAGTDMAKPDMATPDMSKPDASRPDMARPDARPLDVGTKDAQPLDGTRG